MRRNSHPAGMRNALPVEDEQIRLVREQPYRVQEHRRFAKGQKPGHVGKSDRAYGNFPFDLLQRGEFKDDDHGEGGSFFFIKSDIPAGEESDGAEGIFEADLFPKLPLNRKSFPGRDIPIMKLPDFHAASDTVFIFQAVQPVLHFFERNDIAGAVRDGNPPPVNAAGLSTSPQGLERLPQP